MLEYISKYNAVDVFSGCGGLAEGIRQAGFNVRAAIDIDPDAVSVYKMNHPKTEVIQKDIRTVETEEIKKILKDKPLHSLAGCPPCQGFSSIRRLEAHLFGDVRFVLKNKTGEEGKDLDELLERGDVG